MFKKEYIERTSEIFTDLWSIDLNEIPGILCSLTSRLLPLNKVFPEMPTRKQMRAILIGSALQKLLEARFLQKLTNYMTDKLTPSQTGFVPQMGTQVNLIRALFWINENSKINRNTYGLFIDFANAYNTVPHELLFRKLREKRCMDEDEIKFLEALYSRYRIRIGNRFVRFNKGLAQGCILSPALFNIFTEDLVEKLAKELEMSVEDILLYADDILILCKTVGQVKRCVQIIEEWSVNNGMELNKKKSGIVVFAPRSAKNIPYMQLKVVEKKGKKGGKTKTRKWISASKEGINGIPIVSKYKYLGTYLDSKLTMKTQLNFIRKKSNHLFVKLYPYLTSATAQGRKDMWRTMVSPLFTGILALLHFGKSLSHHKKMIALWRETFRKFMLIPKNTNSELVDDMIGIDLYELRDYNAENAALKWQTRRHKTELKLAKKPKYKDYLKGVPNDWCTILKQQFSLCRLCKNKTTKNAFHMESEHQIEILSYKLMWEEIKKFYDDQTEKHKKKNSIIKVKRSVFLKKWTIIKRVREILEERLGTISK